MKTLRLSLIILFIMAAGNAMALPDNVNNTANKERVISVDFSAIKGPLNTFFNECVGAGRANEGLRADWQQQLAYVHSECGFRYIRMHGLLTDDMGVYREDNKGNPEYNFQYIDELYDYILSIGMKPFVELGFMPGALASGSKPIFWWRGNVTPPKDYDKWAGLIRNLVLHFTERYGKEEVCKWYFEVWNEPNLDGFWAGTQDEYFKLYSYSVKAIKGVCNDYRVGGPATAGAAWVPEMIDFCSRNNLPLDFISTHSYGVNQGYLDENGSRGTILAKDSMSVSGDVINSRRQIEASVMPRLELHYTEWSSSYTPSDPIHDSYHEAAFILEKLKQVGDAATSMSYWTFTDIFEEAGPRFTPFHGGFGLLNYQSVAKPALWSFCFLNRLGKTELKNNDRRSWACKSPEGNVQILFWDYTYTHPGDTVNNQVYYIRDLPPKAKGKVKIEISGVPEGKYRMEVYQTGYRVNDPYTEYIDMKRPDQLTRNQAEQLKKDDSCQPVASGIVQINSDKKLVREFDIRENDVFLVNLVKLK